jgi:hypothetical protein
MYRMLPLEPEGVKVMFDWIALPLHIREIPGSNFGSETGHPD